MAKTDEQASSDGQANPTPAATPQAPVAIEAAAVAPANPAPVVYPTHLDETQPGGRYIIDGRTVDAHGNPVRDR